jgi:cellulose synthase/poly-beta-1,6-N-acetylglucosamine synthase-like glycosyltransferase
VREALNISGASGASPWTRAYDSDAPALPLTDFTDAFAQEEIAPCDLADAGAAGPDITVIIPACNEALVIDDCLRALFHQSTDRRVEIIVAANGCTDDTAIRARELVDEAHTHDMRLLVLESPKGSKSLALNAADGHATGRVRVYLDADIRIGPNVLDEVFGALTSGETMLCAPTLRVAKVRSSFTHTYASVWSRLPVVRNDVIGCGFYAVNAAGRARWNTFPDLIADDKFVRLQFKGKERAVLPQAEFVVQMPEGFRELVRVRGRWCRGNRDLARAFPNLVRNEPNRIVQAARLIIGTPRLWAAAPIFVLVFLLGELLALRHSRRGITIWERANCARQEIACRRDRASQIRPELMPR